MFEARQEFRDDAVANRLEGFLLAVALSVVAAFCIIASGSAA